jgi:hypothetical protein
MAHVFRPAIRPYSFKSSVRRALLEKIRQRDMPATGLLTVEEARQAFLGIIGKTVAPGDVEKAVRRYPHLGVLDERGRLLGVNEKRWSYFVRAREGKLHGEWDF